MSWFEILLFIIALMVMLVGFVGIILPVVPGVPIIFGAAFLYAILTDFETIGGQTLVVFALLTIASLLLDWLTAILGVKKMGGSKAGIIGALIGMIAGLFLPGVGIIGFIAGAFIGACMFELLFGQKAKGALRAGLGSFIGFLAGGLIKFIIGSAMILIFVWRVVF